MATIPAITSRITVPEDAWTAPGPSHGLVERVRDTVGGYLGPQLSPDTIQEYEITGEKAASGPRDIVFPWFLPFHDSSTLHETAAMRLAYRQMLKSPHIKTALLGKIFGIASLTLKILPADKKNDRDKAIAKHIEWMLTERLRDTVPGLVWAILSGGLIDGYSINEKVWCLEDKGRYAGKYSLKALKPKDTNNDIVLQTDEYRNVVGLLGLRYNGGQEFSPANFLIWRHLPLFDNPTGFSDFASCYGSYWMLDTVRKLRALATEKYSLPMLLGSYQNTTVKTSLETALKKAKSQRWLSVPEACKVTVLEMAGAAEDIYKSFTQDLIHEIFLSIAGAVLQQLEGETTNGRGDSQVHESTADKFVRFLANSVESCLNDRDTGLIKDCVDLNHVVAEYPKAKLSSVDVNETTQKVQVYTALNALGLDLSKDQLYEETGMTPPEDDDDILPGKKPEAPPSPEQGPPGAPGGGGGLPFDDLELPPAEGAAHPFRGQRFSERWQHYLDGGGTERRGAGGSGRREGSRVAASVGARRNGRAGHANRGGGEATN